MRNYRTLAPDRRLAWLVCGVAMVVALVTAAFFDRGSEASTLSDEAPQVAEAADAGCGEVPAVEAENPLGLDPEAPAWSPLSAIERADCHYRCVNSGGEENGFFACPTGWSLERCCAKLRQVCADQGGLAWAGCQGINNWRICFTTWPPWED